MQPEAQLLILLCLTACLCEFVRFRSVSDRLDRFSGPPPQCDMTEFPLLPYLDDESLEQKIKEVLILRSRIELGKTLGKGEQLRYTFIWYYYVDNVLQ